MKKNLRTNEGLIKTIIIIIIAIAILSVLGINLKNVFTSDTAKSNFSYVWNGVVYVWDHYLIGPATFIWNTIIVGIIWNLALLPLIHSLQTLSNSTSH